MAERSERQAQPARGPVVAATKLRIPVMRPGLVQRTGLVSVLTRAQNRMTLISAAAGSGKTTLLTEWHGHSDEKRRFAWLSLDGDDNDPVRFWTCVIEALRTLEPGIGEAPAALRAPGTSLTGEVVPAVINQLLAIPQPIVLVIDDYHLITDPRIHASTGFLIDRLPPTVHLALATRSDPALPVPRLRAQGHLTEVRAEDLRFSDEEAAAVLRGFGLDLDADQIAQLQRRTEGWAAGIQLAALSLRGRSSPREFIASFAGDDRQIVDYLWSEVLAGQDPALMTFMRRTSILERLSAPLCEAVTGDDASAARLGELDRSNLFTVPLDDNRHWYRYHHLFGQLLRGELGREDRELVPELHRRAATWYSEEGSISDAIRHALAAGETAMAAELTAEHWSEFFNAGFLTTVAGWLAALPQSAVFGDSRLWLAGVWTAMDQGELGETERWLERGEVAIEDAQETTREDWLHVLRALHRFKSGDVGGARDSIDGLDALTDRGSPFWRTVACCVQGVAAYWSGRSDEAEAAFEQGGRLAASDGNALGTVYSLGYLGWIHIDRGREPEAEQVLRHAEELIDEEPQIDQHFTAMVAHLARGRLLERQGALTNADAESRRALALARRGAGGLELSAALLLCADVQHTLGDTVEAHQLMVEAERVLESCHDPAIAYDELARVRRVLRAGGAGPTDVTPGAELSERELGVLRLLPSGLSLRQIGGELYVSLNTVKTHVRHIYGKLDAENRNEAVARAHELGLL